MLRVLVFHLRKKSSLSSKYIHQFFFQIIFCPNNLFYLHFFGKENSLICYRVTKGQPSQKNKDLLTIHQSKPSVVHSQKKYWCVFFIAQLIVSGRHRFEWSQNLNFFAFLSLSSFLQLLKLLFTWEHHCWNIGFIDILFVQDLLHVDGNILTIETFQSEFKMKTNYFSSYNW